MKTFTESLKGIVRSDARQWEGSVTHGENKVMPLSEFLSVPNFARDWPPASPKSSPNWTPSRPRVPSTPKRLPRERFGMGWIGRIGHGYGHRTTAYPLPKLLMMSVVPHKRRRKGRKPKVHNALYDLAVVICKMQIVQSFDVPPPYPESRDPFLVWANCMQVDRRWYTGVLYVSHEQRCELPETRDASERLTLYPRPAV